MDDSKRAFIVDSWVSSYRDAARQEQDRGDAMQAFCARLRDGAYYNVMREYVSAVLATSRVDVVEPEPGIYAGWIATREGELEYLYVKTNFRRSGYATRMLDAASPTHYRLATRRWVVEWLERKGLGKI